METEPSLKGIDPDLIENFGALFVLVDEQEIDFPHSPEEATDINDKIRDSLEKILQQSDLESLVELFRNNKVLTLLTELFQNNQDLQGMKPEDVYGAHSSDLFPEIPHIIDQLTQFIDSLSKVPKTFRAQLKKILYVEVIVDPALARHNFHAAEKLSVFTGIEREQLEIWMVGVLLHDTGKLAMASHIRFEGVYGDSDKFRRDVVAIHPNLGRKTAEGVLKDELHEEEEKEETILAIIERHHWKISEILESSGSDISKIGVFAAKLVDVFDAAMDHREYVSKRLHGELGCDVRDDLDLGNDPKGEHHLSLNMRQAVCIFAIEIGFQKIPPEVAAQFFFLQTQEEGKWEGQKDQLREVLGYYIPRVIDEEESIVAQVPTFQKDPIQLFCNTLEEYLDGKKSIPEKGAQVIPLTSSTNGDLEQLLTTQDKIAA